MKTVRYFLPVMISVIASGATPALAIHRIPVKPLAGYKCMALDAPESKMMDFNNPIPLREAPNDNAPVIAPALAVLPVSETVPETNGYVKSTNLIFKEGWVPSKWVKPYSVVHPGVTCKPYVMNDGKLGFVFSH